MPTPRHHGRHRVGRACALGVVAVLACGLLSACGLSGQVSDSVAQTIAYNMSGVPSGRFDAYVQAAGQDGVPWELLVALDKVAATSAASADPKYVGPLKIDSRGLAVPSRAKSAIWAGEYVADHMLTSVNHVVSKQSAKNGSAVDYTLTAGESYDTKQQTWVVDPHDKAASTAATQAKAVWIAVLKSLPVYGADDSTYTGQVYDMAVGWALDQDPTSDCGGPATPGSYGPDGSPSLLGGPSVSEQQFEAWWAASGHPAPAPSSPQNPEYGTTKRQTVASVTGLYWSEATAEGVRPDMAEIQMIEETGSWSNTDSVVGNNPAGIDHFDSASAGTYFPTAQMGVRGHIQRLKQIVDGDSVKFANPTATTVNGTPIDTWGGRQITYWGDMGGTVNGVVIPGGWATDPDYWSKLKAIWDSLLAYTTAHGGLLGGGTAPSASPSPSSSPSSGGGSSTPSPSTTPSASAASSSSSGSEVVSGCGTTAPSGDATAVVQWAQYADGVPYSQVTSEADGYNVDTGAYDCHDTFTPSCKLNLEDCSGFAQWVMWNALHVQIGRDTRAQLTLAEQQGEVVFQTNDIVADQAKLQVGDLIYSGTAPGADATDHVVIYVGNGMINEASTYGELSAPTPLYNFLTTMTVVRLKALSGAQTTPA